MGDGCRLVFQERVGPAFENATFDRDSQLGALRIQNDFEILTFQAFANSVRLAEQMHVTISGHLTNKDHASSGNRQQLGEHDKSRWQFLKSLAPGIVSRLRLGWSWRYSGRSS